MGRLVNTDTGPDTYIENIKAENFLSFLNLDINLNKFNLVIGANASGKTNFVRLLKFAKDITTKDLKEVIDRQGGLEYLINFNAGTSHSLAFEVTLRSLTKVPAHSTNLRTNKLYITKATYRFKIKPARHGEYEIVDDAWHLQSDIYNNHNPPALVDVGEITIKKSRSRIEIKQKFGRLKEPLKTPSDQYSDDLWPYIIGDSKSLLIHSTFIKHLLYDIIHFLSSVKIYDFDPKLAKSPTQMRGQPDLSRDGSNLAFVLKKILEDKNKRRAFLNLLNDVLGFVDSAGTKILADRSIHFTLDEIYFKDKPIPSFVVSDGTVNVSALIVALYFQEASLIMIEDPERSIHPYLVFKIVEMMKEESNRKQIIATTHNPIMIRDENVKNVMTVKRNNGHSEMTRLEEQSDIKPFLDNEIGLEELYIRNLLDE